MGLFSQTLGPSPSAPPSGGNFFQNAVTKNTPAPVAPAPKLGDGAAGEFAGNAVRAVAAPLFSLGGSIEGALGMKQGAASAKATAASLKANADTSASGKAGTVVGTVAPYLTGAGEEEGAALGAKTLANTGSRALSYVASRAPAAIANTAIGTAQTGSVIKGAEAAAFNEVAAPIIKGVKGLILPTDAAKEAKQLESSIESVMPKRTPTVKASGERSNPTGPLGKIKPVPTTRDAQVGKTVNEIPGYAKAKTLTEKENVVKGEIANRSENVVKPFLEKNPVPFHAADYRKYMELNVKPSARFSANPRAQAAYERVINQGIDIVDQSLKNTGEKLNSTNFDEIWNARKAFAQAADKESLDYTEGSDGKLGVEAAVEDFYKAHGDFIADSIGNPGQIEQINKATDFLQEYEARGNKISSAEQAKALLKQFNIKTDDDSVANAAFFRNQMREIANMYEASGNLAKKAGSEEGSTIISRFEKAHPTLTKAGIGLAAIAADKVLKQTTGIGF